MAKKKKQGKAIGWDRAMSQCLQRARREHPNWSQERLQRYCAGGLRRTGILKYGKKKFIQKMKKGRKKKGKR